MFIKLLSGMTLTMLMTVSVQAQQNEHMTEHGGKLYHRFKLEAETGVNEHVQNLTDWELDGWYGSDKNRLRIDGSGLYKAGSAEHTELSLMYSRNLSTYWDAKIGVRQDTRPESISYLAVGIEGLAPYFFETNLHAFVSESGDVSIRLRQENDVLMTQRLILQPYMETELYLQDIREQKSDRGLSSIGLGLQLRYEYTRKFAPYLDIKYEHLFWNSSSTTRITKVDRNTVTATAGIRLMF